MLWWDELITSLCGTPDWAVREDGVVKACTFIVEVLPVRKRAGNLVLVEAFSIRFDQFFHTCSFFDLVTSESECIALFPFILNLRPCCLPYNSMLNFANIINTKTTLLPLLIELTNESHFGATQSPRYILAIYVSSDHGFVESKAFHII